MRCQGISRFAAKSNDLTFDIKVKKRVDNNIREIMVESVTSDRALPHKRKAYHNRDQIFVTAALANTKGDQDEQRPAGIGERKLLTHFGRRSPSQVREQRRRARR